jgi:hypothetical protein
MNTWRGSAIVVVIDAEVVVVEELHRRGVTGATELSPRASIGLWTRRSLEGRVCFPPLLVWSKRPVTRCTHPPPQARRGCRARRSGKEEGAGRQERGQRSRGEQGGGGGCARGARGKTARRSCRGCSLVREAAATRAAPAAARRVRGSGSGGGQPAEQQRQRQTARRSRAGRRAGSRASGLTRVAERRRPARGTAAGQAGTQGANSQQQSR